MVITMFVSPLYEKDRRRRLSHQPNSLSVNSRRKSSTPAQRNNSQSAEPAS